MLHQDPPGDLEQVAKEMFFLCLVMAALQENSQDSPVMTAYVCAILLARFLLAGKRGDGVFFLLGCLIGGGNDILSMMKGVYAYKPDHIFKEQFDLPIPPWMILFWGQVFVAFRHLFLLPVFQGPKRGRRRGGLLAQNQMALDLATAVALRVIIYRTVGQEPWPTALYALVLAARFSLLPPQAHELLLLVVSLVLGVGVEGVLIGSDLYDYKDPVFLGLPGWLILYWTFAIPILLKGVFDLTENKLATPRRRGWPWTVRFA